MEILAKLLAQENIDVRTEAGAKTAAFDIVNRVMIRPEWIDLLPTDAASVMIDLHECAGHGRYTYEEDFRKFSAIHGKTFYNVVEDVRIDNLVKYEYKGALKFYTRGARDLEAAGLFGDIEFVENFNFVDRLNLHFKCPHLIVPFTDDEKTLVKDMTGFTDVNQIEGFIRRLYALNVESLERLGEKAQEMKDASDDSGSSEESSDDNQRYDTDQEYDDDEYDDDSEWEDETDTEDGYESGSERLRRSLEKNLRDYETSESLTEEALEEFVEGILGKNTVVLDINDFAKRPMIAVHNGRVVNRWLK